MKPPGLAMALVNGMPVFVPTPIDRVCDQIWEAVREAINANMTPDKFKNEVIAAWEYELNQDAKYAARVMRGK